MHSNLPSPTLRSEVTQKVDSKMAVLLNANAKLVSEEIQAAIAHILSPEDIFLSRTLSDAHSIAREVVDRGYDTVFTRRRRRYVRRLSPTRS